MTNLPVPNPAVPTAGQLITNAWFTANVSQPLQYLSQPPIALMYKSADMAALTSSWGFIGLDTVTIDTYGGHSGTHTSQYVAQVAGYYLVNYAVTAETSGGSGSSTFAAGLRINGTGTTAPNVIGSESIASMTGGNFGVITGTSIVHLNVNDYIEIVAESTSGSVVTRTTAGFAPVMQIIWLHT